MNGTNCALFIALLFLGGETVLVTYRNIINLSAGIEEANLHLEDQRL